MFGADALSRIVRLDTKIEVKVPAKQGRKAYSYFREGAEDEKKSSGRGKKIALIGGGLVLAGLGAAAIAMNSKKTEANSVTIPPAENKRFQPSDRRRNAAIAAGVGAVATSIALGVKVAAKTKSQPDLSKYVSESSHAVWTQALDNRSDDSISIGGEEVTDTDKRQAVVSSILGLGKKSKQKKIEMNDFSVRESDGYLVLEAFRDKVDVLGRIAPIVLAAKKPPQKADSKEVEQARQAIIDTVKKVGVLETSYSSLLSYLNSKAYH